MKPGITRYKLEQALGGNFEQSPVLPSIRANGRFKTYKKGGKCYLQQFFGKKLLIAGKSWRHVYIQIKD